MARAEAPARRRRRPPRPARRIVFARPGRRIAVCSVVVILVFGALAMRVTQLQVLSGSRFKRLALSQTLQTIPLPAQRGAILDRNGRALALSIELTSIYADPTQVTDPIVYAAHLAPILHVSRELLVRRLSDPTHRFEYLARRVTDDVVRRVRRLGLVGVYTLPEPARRYPAGSLAGSVIGAVGGAGTGLDGLEYLYESMLAGRPGRLVVERDNQGLEIPDTARHEIEARRGTDVVLTLDESMQWQAEQSLANEVTATGAQGGMAAIVDVRNGDVLALASIDGATATAPAHPSGPGERTSPLMDLFEPGSTNKLITLSSAIEQGLVTPSTMIDVPAALRVGSATFTDVDPHGDVRMSVTDILRQSSNIGTIEIAQRMSKDRLAGALRAFGLGEPTTIDFPGQAAGLLLSPDRYYDTGLASTAIGYGVAVTGVQMLDAYATIANGGVSRPPRLLDATIDAQGRRHPAPVRTGARVVSAQTAREMTDMLTGVVSGGTGVCAAIPGYTVAGKTGTSHKALATGGYSSGTMASFIGYAPARNPRLAALVVLDEPTNTYGGAAAAPVFADLMQFALTRADVAPDDVTNTQYDTARGAAAATGTQCITPGAAASAAAASRTAAAKAAAAQAAAASHRHHQHRSQPAPDSVPPTTSLTTDTSRSG